MTANLELAERQDGGAAAIYTLPTAVEHQKVHSALASPAVIPANNGDYDDERAGLLDDSVTSKELSTSDAPIDLRTIFTVRGPTAQQMTFHTIYRHGRLASLASDESCGVLAATPGCMAPELLHAVVQSHSTQEFTLLRRSTSLSISLAFKPPSPPDPA